jgi:RNase adaptor protein for sRNA GlmZ degradation
MKIIYQLALGKEGRVLRLPVYSKLPVIDCRKLPNPFRKNVAHELLVDIARKMPGYDFHLNEAEKVMAANDRVIVGCQFGKHRSVAMTLDLAKRFTAKGETVRVYWDDNREETFHPPKESTCESVA